MRGPEVARVSSLEPVAYKVLLYHPTLPTLYPFFTVLSNFTQNALCYLVRTVPKVKDYHKTRYFEIHKLAATILDIGSLHFITRTHTHKL